MLRLIRSRDRERGAVAVIVGLVVAMFVLTGVAALAIDAGSIYAERRVVQNAADAAALALAQVCANGDAAKCSVLWEELTVLANRNSPADGATDIASVCGSTAPFTSCDPLPLSPSGVPVSPSLVQCTALPQNFPTSAKYVEVRTITHSDNPSDSSVVGKYFANLFKTNYYGKSVHACARAAWGPATKGPSTIPMTISECEWKRNSTDGLLPSPDPLKPYSDTYLASDVAIAREKTLYFHNTTGANGCLPTPPSGFDLPGGFGYLNNDACEVFINPDLMYLTKPGNSYPNLDCDFTDFVGHVVNIPVFVDTNGKTGNNLEYKLDGVGSFFLTGFKVQGNSRNVNHTSIVGPSPHGYPNCPPADLPQGSNYTCMFGWFTKDYMPGGEFVANGTGTARGAMGAGFAG